MISERGLRASRVAFSYEAQRAVHDISLSLEPGDTLALTGSNGSGKTTLLRILSGALRPAQGKVTIDGTDMRGAAPRDLARQIAVVPQHVDATLSLKVDALVALGRTPYTGLLRPLSAHDRTLLREAMEATDTMSLREKRFSELSGGEQRRVALAMAMAQGTTYLLLDEPTMHLDLHHQSAFFELLQRMRAVREVGILAVMHDLNLAALYFESMAVIDAGSLIALDRPEQIMTNLDVMRVFRAPLDVVSHPQSGVPQVLLRRDLGNL